LGKTRQNRSHMTEVRPGGKYDQYTLGGQERRETGGFILLRVTKRGEKKTKGSKKLILAYALGQGP